MRGSCINHVYRSKLWLGINGIVTYTLYEFQNRTADTWRFLEDFWHRGYYVLLGASKGVSLESV